MKRPCYIKTIILLLSLSTFFSSHAQKEIDFRFQLEEGMCFDVQTLSSQESISTSKDAQESKSESIVVIQYHVVSRKPDFYRLNFMFTDYLVTVTGVKKFTVDPKAADKLNILDVSNQVSIIMNKPFSAELSPKGEILNMKGNKAIAKEFKTKTKKLSPGLRGQVSVMMESLAGRKSLIDFIESWTDYIPDFAVKLGEQWNVRKDSSATLYTFVAETDSTYVIEGTGNSKKTVTNEIQKG